MKTNQLMKRRLDNFEVIQQTSDGFFDANNLLQQWNKNSIGAKREMSKFLKSPKTKEFIEEIIEQEALSQKSHLALSVVCRTVKGRNTKKGRVPDKVWMHPYLFLDFAMYLSPKFKYQVIKFVYDQLIEYRIDSGDLFKEMNSALNERFKKEFNTSATPDLYIKEARRIKGSLGVNNWNTATELQLEYRKRLEQINIMAFSKGYSFEKRMIIFCYTVEEFKSKLFR